MKKSLFTAVLALAFAATSFLVAEVPGDAPGPANHRQHRIEFLTKLLTLTPEQQQQAATIFTNAATTMQTLHGNMRTSHQGLEQAIKNNDATAIDQNANAIGTATAQMIAARAKAHAAFFQILTPDQQAKLSQFESEHHQHRGHQSFRERHS